jgi:hypothetical protein
MIDYFGKAKGTFLNYAFSWISMFVIIIVLSIVIGVEIAIKGIAEQINKEK